MAKKKKKPVFDIPVDSTPEATKLALGFKAEGNLRFKELTDDAEDLIQRFWYRNRDNDGEPSLTRVVKVDDNGDPVDPAENVTDDPTGEEIMAAMGTDAEAIWGMAVSRATLLVELSTTLGKPDTIDGPAMAGPMDLTFNPDGTFLSATPKN